MHTITIPDELNLENSLAVQVFDYSSSKGVSKQQIILNQNTFSFLIEGTKEVVFDNSALSIDDSQFLVMKSGNCLMTEKLSEVSNYRSVLLFFSNEMLSKFIRKIELEKIESKGYQSVFAFEYDEFLKRFVDSLVDLSKLSKNLQNKILEVKLEEIMLYLLEKHGTDFLYSLSVNADNTTQKFIQVIENSHLNKLTLKELAFLCNMSVSTFKREFEKHYSESPIKWFQNKRLEFAHFLLQQKQKNPSEVYFEVGYENLSSFTQAYKSKYGVTPKHHQKN
ncbi:Exoenzyme S synthesis regulatory protein ExsA [Flavobacterium bizetiae]|uniref:Exoenzyme S synthesis regulatory protein ExsA n=1 Tax=Flavobacterium bizetiae TaxID=2704140 RepID=A0A6J4GL70_9FLAO|nr:AraC family transcriptional regulator [Flavobacterium bizetiae]CAA9199671.1 Exoenzyme S synthesis regulatory protein ExsA [Flavobacterium bizetiae]CAD5343645.1 Exoenzyme S synthesis regulatory protein ExsA [Flavobacterium bizetiae]CAD5346931.1 Exoenzyme S synthesis regulatory protein ExsA [Flavobacterium bizetiae]